jgi:hypothetical protein
MYSYRFVLGVLLLAVGGCTTSAPQLPMDTTATNRQGSLSQSDFSSSDLYKSCSDIKAEQIANASRIASDNQAILGNRKQNEVAGYMGGILLVPYAATESNSAEKDDIAMLQKRQDTLIKLSAFKQCPN